MRTTFFTLALLAVLALLGGDSALFSQGKVRPKPSTRFRELMKEKLKNSQVLLEGIALADFAKIRRSAEILNQMTKTEEWHILKTPRYEMHSNEFRRAADALIEKAKGRNIDGVTLSYFELTMACVRCHQYVREVRDARLPAPPSKEALVALPRR
jgi:cytochrome c556